MRFIKITFLTIFLCCGLNGCLWGTVKPVETEAYRGKNFTGTSSTVAIFLAETEQERLESLLHQLTKTALTEHPYFQTRYQVSKAILPIYSSNLGTAINHAKTQNVDYVLWLEPNLTATTITRNSQINYQVKNTLELTLINTITNQQQALGIVADTAFVSQKDLQKTFKLYQNQGTFTEANYGILNRLPILIQKGLNDLAQDDDHR